MTSRRLSPAAAALVLLVALPVGRASAQRTTPPRLVVQAQAGPMFYRFRDYRPVGNAGLNTLLFLPRGLSLLGVVSRDVTPGAPWTGVLALQYRLWAR